MTEAYLRRQVPVKGCGPIAKTPTTPSKVSTPAVQSDLKCSLRERQELEEILESVMHGPQPVRRSALLARRSYADAIARYCPDAESPLWPRKLS
jgi:hypothetical protein